MKAIAPCPLRDHAGCRFFPRHTHAASLAGVVLSLVAVGWSPSQALSAEESNRIEVKDLAGVKAYLIETVSAMKAASSGFVRQSESYAAIVAEHGGDPTAALQAKREAILKLHGEMQESYKAMDSFGYETVEGIVAGVVPLAQYDIDLDAGVPASEGPDDVAQIRLELEGGGVVDREGALFTYIIEPSLWGGDPRWVVPADLDGDGAVKDREALPKAALIVASARDIDRRIGDLLRDSKAWEPTSADAFGAMITMTPTLPDYFEDWKESRYGDGTLGRFAAVSRVSDMKGIMSSCAVLFRAVADEVKTVDPALETAITGAFREIDVFLNDLATREEAGKISAPVVEELAQQAKERTDALVPQIEQAWALVRAEKPGESGVKQ